jgi:hypothetical protein
MTDLTKAGDGRLAVARNEPWAAEAPVSVKATRAMRPLAR